MPPETDLATLLAELRPQRRPGTVVMTTVPDLATLGGLAPLAAVLEDEGVGVVLRAQDARALRLAEDVYEAAWITLRVQSALEAVGLTAAVSTALAEQGISCNVLAGYHHDHLLVPADRADDALAVLEELSRSAR